VTDVAVRTEGLTKEFRGRGRAVDDLTFEVRRGSVVGLLGPNGAGKTTTMRMLLGLIKPTAGTAYLLDREIAPSDPVLSRVGTLVERPSFVPHLSGLANLKLWWRSGGYHWPPPGLDHALDIAGLGEAIDRRTKTYSQGMRQRLGIAQVLMSEPELLLLDEPTNGLDPQEMRAIRLLLGRLGRGGVTVLVSSHLLGEVEETCTDVVVMDQGRLVAAGAVRDIVGHSDSVYVELDDPARGAEMLSRIAGVRVVAEDFPGHVIELDGVTRPELVAALVAAGVGVQTVAPRRRLEDAFLDLLDHEQSL
jgi:ABC-2 type transport system ATP-binding protein